MDTDQRLSTRMTQGMRYMVPENEGWNQFIHDHKSHILENSVLQTFDKAVMMQYRYRPEDFFVDNDHSDIRQATWIWMFVNDIRDLTEFDGTRTKFYMMTKEFITDLWDVYRGSANADVPQEEL